MQILWVTPFNTRSAIGTYSREVCEELVSRGHDVRIMRVESGAEARWPAISTSIQILGPDDAIPADIDLVIINYGNHAPYHAGTLRIAAERPAIAVFHDAEMRHFEGGMQDRHQALMPTVMGEDGLQNAAPSELDIVDPGARPILAALAAMASGAIVHGPHYQPTVAAACPGPVEVLPLCFPDIGTTQTKHECTSTRRVVIFGIISPYKQPDRLLRAVSDLQAEFGAIEVHLAGSIEAHYRSELTNIAADLGVAEPIFHGYLSDQDLSAVLTRADAICCLRHPVTEGGSASLITAMYQGRPLIVSNVASYSMAPDELIHKISYGEEVSDLASALRRIFLDPAHSDKMALQARDWARITYSSATYVDRLEILIARVMDILPVVQALRQLTSHAISPDGRAMPSALFAMAQATEELFKPRQYQYHDLADYRGQQGS
ncbi:glycosyl transferase family 1 [Sphingobium sp. TA15]|uniref:Glycosyltransferase WcbH n=1 Tax=Sphingobium indicum (strain DSM 16413 / CCM 7287 / MTCC 6362 / UT26 / NBRC 101211 / UT26S) TaxID=452662 RepID=D4Z5H7_SPHIU|nr:MULTISPECIES: glycosyltransferase family 4 protein [Sphingobium]WDA38692.1 glycosyltransferase family 4 protein [Sphingobium sp. YC-XJ3]BAI97859.1 glycosyltransferase WcbH [Sphingobium indicum UT26S]BDD67250.1 glycosyl transferase family 1 [Sphingobium sp. TA15]